MKYLNIYESSKSPSGKTGIFNVVNLNAVILGEIKWYGPWRKYVFYTQAENLLFDASCLTEIIEFINEEMNKRRRALAQSLNWQLATGKVKE